MIAKIFIVILMTSHLAQIIALRFPNCATFKIIDGKIEKIVSLVKDLL